MRLLSVQSAVEAKLDAGLAGMGLTPAGFRLVGVLMGEPEGLRQRELADRLGVRPPTISAAIPRLEALGIVERVDDPDDPRAWRVRLSARAPLVPGVELLEALDREVFSSLSKTERRSLASLLERIGERVSPPRKIR